MSAQSALHTAIGFSLAASITYPVNDVIDREADRAHMTRRLVEGIWVEGRWL